MKLNRRAKGAPWGSGPEEPRRIPYAWVLERESKARRRRKVAVALSAVFLLLLGLLVALDIYFTAVN